MKNRPAPANRTSPFVALQHRDFRLIWIGQFISVAGTQMQTITINWHVWQLTNSYVALGAIGLSRLIPIVLFSLIGGVVADTLQRRRIMLVTQSTMAVMAALLALLTSTGWITSANPLTVIYIYVLSAISAAAVSFDNPARQSLVPNLVPRHHLTNALTLQSIQFQAAAILGPFFAGLVMSFLGIASVYWINAASFLAVIVALLLMQTSGQENLPPKRDIPLSQSVREGFGMLGEGLHFVTHQRIIFSTMLLDFFATFFASANTLMAPFATNVLHTDEIGYSLLNAAESSGSVVMAALVSLHGDVRRKGIALLAGISIYALATIGFGVSNAWILAFLALAMVGAGDTLSTIMRQVIRQLVTPDNLRGRMTSVNMIFFMGGPQLGEVESGIAANILGAPMAIVFGGAATLLLVGITAYLVPALREYHDMPHAPPVSAQGNGISTTIDEREAGETHLPGPNELPGGRAAAQRERE